MGRIIPENKLPQIATPADKSGNSQTFHETVPSKTINLASTWRLLNSLQVGRITRFRGNYHCAMRYPTLGIRP